MDSYMVLVGVHGLLHSAQQHFDTGVYSQRGQRSPSGLEKCSPTLIIYIDVQIKGYRLKFSSTAYENAPTRSSSMENSQVSWGHPPHINPSTPSTSRDPE